MTPPGPLVFSSINEAQTLSAKVFDQHGDSLPSRVTWSSSSSAVVTVDSTGVVTARGNGAATVTATVGALRQPVLVSVVQAAANVWKAGDNQLGNPGVVLATPLIVWASDSGGSAAIGVAVRFSVTAGDGSVSTTTTTTDASGLASTTWALGASGTRQSVTATVGSHAPVTFTATAIALAPGFQIAVANVGPAFDPAVQAALDSATAFWQRAITDDVPDWSGISAPPDLCIDGQPAIPRSLVFDDVVVLVRLDSIDGPGGILGFAGPCFVRTNGSAAPFATSFPVIGVMEFDSADVRALITAGQFNSVIRHEMAHVLGFGSLWPATLTSSLRGFGCLQNPSSSGSNVDTYYNCARARVVFDSIGGTGYTGGNKVPVENCVGITGCGAGTYNSHWRESVFFNELMTGFLNAGVANPLSAVTLAAMQDLGYTVNYAAADPYVRTFSVTAALRAAGSTPAVDLGDDIYHGPIYVVDGTGRVVGVFRR